jgi:cation transport regulator ChaC
VLPPDRSHAQTSPPGPVPVWIFGYGSLIWRAAFPHVVRRPARIDGWSRRFWQGSTDHRGVPGAPGRVVTLVREPAAFCTGVAYGVAEPHVANVLAELDDRERGGYVRHSVPLLLASLDGEPALTTTGWVYVADDANPNYLGPASLAEIVAVVRGAHGPSGPNLEYALRLADALRALGAEDDEVFALERALLEL